jgi:CheY-like chemotaxis protein
MKTVTQNIAPKILIVEDESIAAEHLANNLKTQGYPVVAIADSGEKAIQVTQQTDPDLILMDITLQGNIDGIEAAERIQAQQQTPVIYMTAYADYTALERVKQTDFYGYIVKPFKPQDLRIAIEMTWHRYQANSPKFWLDRGEHWASVGEYKKALDHYNQAIELNPNDPKAWIGRGGVLSHLNRYKAALRSFEQALVLDPDNQSAMLFRGVTLHHLGRYRDAYVSYAKSLALR